MRRNAPVSGARITLDRHAPRRRLGRRRALRDRGSSRGNVRAARRSRIGQAAEIDVRRDGDAPARTRASTSWSTPRRRRSPRSSRSASRRVEKITDAPATISTIDVQTIDNTHRQHLRRRAEGSEGHRLHSGRHDERRDQRARIQLVVQQPLPDGRRRAHLGHSRERPSDRQPHADAESRPRGHGGARRSGLGAVRSGCVERRALAPHARIRSEFQGGTLELTGGSRSYKDLQGRYAGVYGNWGYKVAGEVQDANDWQNYSHYNAGGSIVAPGTAGAVREDALKVPIDWQARVDARHRRARLLHRRQSPRGERRHEQDRRRRPDERRPQSARPAGSTTSRRRATRRRTGTSTRIARESQVGKIVRAQPLSPARSSRRPTRVSRADSLRMLSDWPSDGRMYAAEVQGNYIDPAARATRRSSSARSIATTS